MNNVRENKVIIRHMTLDDVPAIIALDRELNSGSGLLSYNDMATIERGGRLDLNFVAEVDGKIGGFILAQLTYLMIPFTEVCIIQGIFADPKYHEHHLGSKLMQALLDHCQTEGINRIRTLIPEHNIELQQFAERHGFQRSNIINFDKIFDS
ncbi:MAG: N-acetyltransferase family protein [Dehalococcoidales bacterium]